MYRDPSRIRSHVVKVRFSDEENRLVEALADYTGEQKAVLIREAALEHVRAVLFGEESAPAGTAVEGTYRARCSG